MVRMKVSVTIEEKIVEWINDMVDRGVFRNRSHMMEETLKHVKHEGIKRMLFAKLEGTEED